MSELYLIPIAFLTSSLAGIMGMGGGILLITLMPGLVPTAAILPIHAATQLASNVSRVAFGWREIDPGIIPAFTVGAIAGVWLGAGVYQSLDLRWVPALIGALILLLTWVPLPKLSGSGPVALAFLGFYQTGLGMLAGATGPLGSAVLLRHHKARDWLVVNTALYMSLSHALRVLAFAAIGFSFAPWWQLVLAMIVASVAGSWVVTRLRTRVAQVNFERLFRLLVTVLALRMIALPFLAA
ncbi:MAG: TSUP family transporter [Halioglobus sp.]|nr:TSUP family transporter [Halioglobus sp.]